MNTVEQFAKWYEQFKQHRLYKDMASTVEGSPWHREASVAVHTDMVVAEFMKLSAFANLSEQQTVDGLIACAFHDVGKPRAEVVVNTPERGEHRRYGGHEQLSARLYEDYCATHHPEMYKWEIAWMIEHHLPWAIKDVSKLSVINTTVRLIGTSLVRAVWHADQLGRDSDDKPTNIQRTVDWFEQMLQTPVIELNEADLLGVMFLIGPSGCGKSTYIAELTNKYNKEALSFSLDTLRHQWYDSVDYARAFELSTQDKTFESRAQLEFDKLVQRVAAENLLLVVDNTNLTTKRRAALMRRIPSQLPKTAVTLPSSRDLVVQRQQTRSDKSVPESAVIRQYMSLQQPSYGEFDRIIVSRGNL